VPMFRLLFLTFFFVGLCQAAAQAQRAANPFELVHRLPPESLLASSAGTTEPTNPFDMVPHRAPVFTSELAENATEAFRPFAVLPRGDDFPEGLMAAFLIAGFAFLAFSIAANRSALGKAWGAFLSDNGFSIAQREASGFLGNTPYYLLYSNFLFNAGIFAFLVTRVFHPKTFNNLPFFFFCLTGVSSIFLFKHLMLRIVRWLFPVEAEAQKYNFLIVVFNCVLGLFLVPFNLLIAFSAQGPSEQLLLVSWMLGLLAIVYLYRTVRASSIGAKFLSQGLFHFLLYLCTVEIVPVLLLVKIALLQIT
jgi:hypothetical protein